MDQDNPLVVIGAGLPRTGTASLKKALEIIYGKPCYHMFEVKYRHPEHCQLWNSMYKASLIVDKPVINEEWIANIFRGYGAVVDAPANALYEALMCIYPEAKVILTVREPETWVQSVRGAMLPRHDRLKNSFIERLVERLTITTGFFEMVDNLWCTCFGSNINLSDDEQIMNAFNKWNNAVKSKVPEHRLLVYEIRTGWEPLCKFLGVPIPNEPFPHLNDRASFSTHLKVEYRIRMLIRMGICATGLGLAALCVRYFENIKCYIPLH